MGDHESTPKISNEKLERTVVERLGQVISSIDEATHADQVIAALCSLAVQLFPVDPLSISGIVEEKHRDELLNLEVPEKDERLRWWNFFYKGSAFRAFARVLLYDIASSWLACFPTSARRHVYDVFFLEGPTTEVIQEAVPCLRVIGNGEQDVNAVCSNAERLLVLCLLENDGVLQIMLEFAGDSELSHEQLKQVVSRISQIITSIPDKARRVAPASFSPHLFFKKITSQILRAAEERYLKLTKDSAFSADSNIDGSILFAGDVFARISRRGSIAVLLSELIPCIHGHVRHVLSSTSHSSVRETFESTTGFQFWLKIMEAANDYHSVERIAEELLRQLAGHDVTDDESYWIMWILFGRVYKRQASIRFAFLEKFLLWKVFPIRCLRWNLHFAVLECPPNVELQNGYNAHALRNTVHQLLLMWSRKEFVQTSPTEHQAYVTAALGLCLEKMTKEDLDATKDGLHSVLQGISCRLESPLYLIRKMASSIAFVFSKIIDPQNPLYLDDSSNGENIDWEFGLTTSQKDHHETIQISNDETDREDSSSVIVSRTKMQKGQDNGVGKTSNGSRKKESIFNLTDPDEVVDPANLIEQLVLNEDESAYPSDDSETSSDSSLQPYDLTDDATDLGKRFSQLVDVVAALRKSDDAEGVEKALDVAEKLIRAKPDELKYIAGDMARTLLQVRCSDFVIEGEEESAEGKRQKSLVALIVTCPNESLDSLIKLLYSPNLDVSQRVMILDVMTEAALELSSTSMVKSSKRTNNFILSTSDQPWYMPRNDGPLGAGSWKEISSTGTPLNWSYSYERDLPSKPGQIKKGKTRRWNLRSPMHDDPAKLSHNIFPQYAAAFMLPVMKEYDKKRHGVDLLGRDFIVLGKLIYMLGICIKCSAMHPEASVLASPFLDMLRSRAISHHPEAYVRRSALFAASCVVLSLHPSFVASAITEHNTDICEGLEWIRSWALQVSDSDTDRECHTLAMGCLQLHAEMVMQASRVLESSKDVLDSANNINLISSVSSKRSIKIPYLN